MRPGPRRRLCPVARCGRGGGLRPGAGEAGEDRLQAFAAEPVVTAVQNSSTASERAIAAYQAWRAAGGSSQTRGAVDEALEAAETADDDVIELIRTGLQGRGKGRPLPDWQPTTAGWT